VPTCRSRPWAVARLRLSCWSPAAGPTSPGSRMAEYLCKAPRSRSACCFGCDGCSTGADASFWANSQVCDGAQPFRSARVLIGDTAIAPVRCAWRRAGRSGLLAPVRVDAGAHVAPFVRERSRPAAAPAFGSLPLGTNTGSLVASGDTALVLAAGVNLANGRADQPVSASGVLRRWGIGAAVAGSVRVTPGVPDRLCHRDFVGQSQTPAQRRRRKSGEGRRLRSLVVEAGYAARRVACYRGSCWLALRPGCAVRGSPRG
jgi:hypothetical protein